jgi:hypothetical protein
MTENVTFNGLIWVVVKQKALPSPSPSKLFLDGGVHMNDILCPKYKIMILGFNNDPFS